MQVRESLMQRATEFNILLDDVAITHLSFGTEVSHFCSSKGFVGGHSLRIISDKWDCFRKPALETCPIIFFLIAVNKQAICVCRMFPTTNFDVIQKREDQLKFKLKSSSGRWRRAQ